MITQCRHPECKAEIVWMLSQSTGKRMPIDATSATREEQQASLPPIFDPKRHISHHATCPFAHEFRKKKPATDKERDARQLERLRARQKQADENQGKLL